MSTQQELSILCAWFADHRIESYNKSSTETIYFQVLFSHHLGKKKQNTLHKLGGKKRVVGGEPQLDSK